MQAQSQPRGLSVYDKLLVTLFLFTLPLVNPWVRGDGVGYYAFARALLVEHGLNFQQDWQRANQTFRMGRVDAGGNLTREQFTPTGRINNHFAIGAGLLWLPFLGVTHGVVLLLNALGAPIPADGFSRPYVVAMALATGFYGFAGLWISFRLARKHVEERWAFLATVGIWLASSLPVYMYFNPSWSHAHSVFAVALFLWYWERTRNDRALRQWVILGLLSGLMLNVYYPNGVLLVVPAVEAIGDYIRRLRDTGMNWHGAAQLFGRHVMYVAAVAAAFLPTLVSKRVIYGDAFRSGYHEEWYWGAPKLLEVLFSANHGLMSWTPILLPAMLGPLCLLRSDRGLAASWLVAFGGFWYFIASYQTWHGLSSYGNRYFVSLTPVFVVGLAAALEQAGRRFSSARRALAAAACMVVLFILWNAGLVFQWGTHLIPVRGPVVWHEVARNQFTVVPRRIAGGVTAYLIGRREMMQEIEQGDAEKLQRQGRE